MKKNILNASKSALRRYEGASSSKTCVVFLYRSVAFHHHSSIHDLTVATVDFFERLDIFACYTDRVNEILQSKVQKMYIFIRCVFSE